VTVVLFLGIVMSDDKHFSFPLRLSLCLCPDVHSVHLYTGVLDKYLDWRFFNFGTKTDKTVKIKTDCC